MYKYMYINNYPAVKCNKSMKTLNRKRRKYVYMYKYKYMYVRVKFSDQFVEWWGVTQKISHSTINVCNMDVVYMYLPKVPLGTNIGTYPKMNIESCLLYQFYELNQIISPFKIVLQKKKRVIYLPLAKEIYIGSTYT